MGIETELNRLDYEWNDTITTSVHSAPIKYSGEDHLAIGIFKDSAEIWTFEWERTVPLEHLGNLILRVYPYESKRTQSQMDKMLDRIAGAMRGTRKR